MPQHSAHRQTLHELVWPFRNLTSATWHTRLLLQPQRLRPTSPCLRNRHRSGRHKRTIRFSYRTTQLPLRTPLLHVVQVCAVPTLSTPSISGFYICRTDFRQTQALHSSRCGSPIIGEELGRQSVKNSDVIGTPGRMLPSRLDPCNMENET